MDRILVVFVLIQTTCSNLQFEEVSTIFNLNTTFPPLDSHYDIRQIRFIQQDKENPQNFLIGVDTALLSVPLLSENSSELEIIVGDIETFGYDEGLATDNGFSHIGALVQTSIGYIVTDIWYSCLHLIQRSRGEKVWQTSTYAGRCDVIGSTDGPKLEARFRQPEGMIERDNVLYIADSENRKLRQLDMNSGEVTTIHEVENYPIYHIAFGNSEKEFFLTTSNGILRIDDQKEAWLVGCVEPVFSQLSKAKFSTAGFDDLLGITKMSDNILLAADAHVVKVVDMDLQEVDVICTGQEGYVDGDIRSCKLTYATSIAVLDDVILIGELNTIRRVPYYFSNSSSMSSITEAQDNGQTSLAAQIDSALEILCGEPPTISNTREPVLDGYTEGTEIYYQCIDSYMLVDEKNTKLICTSNGSRMFWSGERIKCKPSKALVAVMAITPAYIITVLVLVLVIVKLCRERRDHKKENRINNHDYMVPQPEAAFRRQQQRSTQSLPLPQLPTARIDTDYETVNEEPVRPDGMTRPEHANDNVTYIGPYSLGTYTSLLP